MRNGNASTAKYAALQSAYWVSLCAVMPFASVFLLDHEFTSAQVGLIVAWANLLAMLVQPAVGAFADRSRKVFLSSIIAVFGLVSMLAAGILLLPLPKTLVGGMFLLQTAAVMINQPLVNAVCIYYTDRGVNINFGLARGIGSGVYAVVSWAMGLIIHRFGSNAMLICGIVTFAVLILLAFSFRPISDESERMAKEKQQAVSLRGFVRRYPQFTAMLAGCVFLYTFHTYSTTYFYQVVINIGGDSGQMGLSNALAALVELPAMFLFSRIVRRWKCERLLVFAAFAFIAKAAAFYLAPNMLWMNVAQCFQAFSYALYIPATIRYANEIMVGADQNKGQTMLTSANAAGTIIGGLSGGVIIDHFGASAMLLVGIACTVLGAAVFCLTAHRGAKA